MRMLSWSLVLICFGVGTWSACRSQSKLDSAASSLTAINWELPSLASIPQAKRDLVTGFAVQLNSAEPSGANGCTKVDVARSYADIASADLKIRNTCDYSLVLSIGALSSDNKILSKVFYTNKDAKSGLGMPILKTAMAGKGSLSVAVELSLTAEGLAEGFGNLPTPTPSAATGGNSTSPGAQPSPTPLTAPSAAVGTLSTWMPATCTKPVSGKLYPTKPILTEIPLPAKFDLLEGPVWVAAEEALYLSVWSLTDATDGKGPPTTILKLVGSQWSTFSPKGNIRTNGLALSRSGELLAAAHDDRAIIQIARPAAIRQILASAFNGKPFNSPNDLLSLSDGTIFFTDPDYQSDGRSGQGAVRGVYRLAVNGTLSIIDDKRALPNGIAVSPDQSRLYVSGSDGLIQRYQLAKDGSVGAAQAFANPQTSIDGLTIDCLGNVYAALHEAQEVVAYAPDGGEIGRVSIGAKVTNLAFGGKDQTTLFITALGRLFRLDNPVAGAPY